MVAPTAPPTDSPGLADGLRTLRTQTATESLGLGEQSSLLKASLQASVGFVILFAALTFGPFVYQNFQSNAKENAPAKQEAKPPTEPTTPTPAPEPSPKQPNGTPSTGKIPGKGDILDKLGENGTKTGAPKVKDPFKAGGDDDLPGLK